MPAKSAPGEPIWYLDILAFEKTAAAFLLSNNVHTDAQRQTLVDNASAAQITAMVRAFFNCMISGV